MAAQGEAAPWQAALDARAADMAQVRAEVAALQAERHTHDGTITRLREQIAAQQQQLAGQSEQLETQGGLILELREAVDGLSAQRAAEAEEVWLRRCL